MADEDSIISELFKGSLTALGMAAHPEAAIAEVSKEVVQEEAPVINQEPEFVPMPNLGPR